MPPEPIAEIEGWIDDGCPEEAEPPAELTWRPTPATPGHETPVENLFHIGASTHPGPGLGAGSGYLVAKQLTRPPLPRRLLSKLPGVP